MSFKPTIYQRLLSYFLPIKLATTQSIYNEYLEVSLLNNKIQLNSILACYSYENLYESFAIAFKKIDFKKQNINKVLVLGGGFCSIPQLLLKYKPNAQFDIVEIDKKVMQLAEEYVKPSILQNCKLINADAIDFLQQSTNTYDLICIDIFIDITVPKNIRNQHFLNLLRSRIREESLIIFSVLENGIDNKQEFDKFIQLFKDHFQTNIVVAGSNKMLFGKLKS